DVSHRAADRPRHAVEARRLGAILERPVLVLAIEIADPTGDGFPVAKDSSVGEEEIGPIVSVGIERRDAGAERLDDRAFQSIARRKRRTKPELRSDITEAKRRRASRCIASLAAGRTNVLSDSRLGRRVRIARRYRAPFIANASDRD